jgi:hypothetical protein
MHICYRGACLPSHCLETALVYLFISRSLHSNGSSRHNTETDIRNLGCGDVEWFNWLSVGPSSILNNMVLQFRVTWNRTRPNWATMKPRRQTLQNSFNYDVKVNVITGLNWLIAIPLRRMGKWRYSSTILKLGTRWERSDSRPGSFSPRKGSLDKRLGGLHSRYGRPGGDKIPFSTGNWTQLFGSLARCLVALSPIDNINIDIVSTS